MKYSLNLLFWVIIVLLGVFLVVRILEEDKFSRKLAEFARIVEKVNLSSENLTVLQDKLREAVKNTSGKTDIRNLIIEFKEKQNGYKETLALYSIAQKELTDTLERLRFLQNNMSGANNIGSILYHMRCSKYKKVSDSVKLFRLDAVLMTEALVYIRKET